MNIPIDSISAIRGINITARGINSITNNSVTNKLTTNPALDRSTDSRGLFETSSPLGEDHLGVVVDSNTTDRGITNPAQNPIWGIDAQLCNRKSQRPTFHLTVQFIDQLANLDAMLTTVYTYPHARLREYKPQGILEQTLYEECRKNPDLMIGRVTTRGSKGDVIDNLLAVVYEQENTMHLRLIYHDWEYDIAMCNEPTYNQKSNYLVTGHWGNQLQLKSTRRRISLQDCPTRTGA